MAFSDSSFADDVDTSRTTVRTLGYVIQANGATISASSKLNASVDSCVNHNELLALALPPPLLPAIRLRTASALPSAKRTQPVDCPSRKSQSK